MTEKEKLMRQLSAAQFAVWELHLFLDTHPEDRMAIESYNKYKKRCDELTKEYKDKYGAFSPSELRDIKKWYWTDEPWPWEVKGGNE